jgi:hypothetical protein
MDLKQISVKDKIKLLSDIQNLLENEELKGGFSSLDSGEIIWNLISEHLQKVTENLLGSGSFSEDKVASETVGEMGKLLSLVKAVNASPLIQVLSQIASRGLNPQAQQQPVHHQEPQIQTAQPRTIANVNNPVSMTPKVGTMGFL